MAAGGRWRGGGGYRIDVWFALHVFMVCQSAGTVQSFVPQRDDCLVDQHVAIQCQPADAVRRLLHFGGPLRDTKPASEIGGSHSADAELLAARAQAADRSFRS